MRVVWLREFGPPDVLEVGDAPDPAPGPGQVVVDVVAAGVNFVETQVRAGRFGADGTDLPTIPGNEVGGVVSAVGAGVDPGLVGRRVVTSTGGSGGYAERVAVSADGVIPVPDGLDLRDATALFTQGRTAVALTKAAAIQPGDRVLVEAAGGGVGSLLVQLARTAGAGMVVAAAGGERKLAVARDLGADVLVDYRDPAWAEWVREATDGAGVDVVFDGVGGDVGRTAFELLAPRGRFVLFGMASGAPTQATLAEVLSRGLIVVGFGGGRQIRSPEHARALAAEALAEAAAGRLRPVIGQTFPLERAADAHAAIESRETVGKTLLVP